MSKCQYSKCWICFKPIWNVSNLSKLTLTNLLTNVSNCRFGDLSSNYVNERVANLAKTSMIERLQGLCKSNGISNAHNIISRSNSKEGESSSFWNLNNITVLPLLDSWSSNTKAKKPKGLLLLIDEAKEPSVFLEKFESEFFAENEFKNLYSVDYRNTIISLCHGNGTRVVDYDVKKILRHAEIVSFSKFTNLLLQESQK